MCHLGLVVEAILREQNDGKCKNLRPCPPYEDGRRPRLHFFDEIDPDILVVCPQIELFLHLWEEEGLQLLNSCYLKVHPRHPSCQKGQSDPCFCNFLPTAALHCASSCRVFARVALNPFNSVAK